MSGFIAIAQDVNHQIDEHCLQQLTTSMAPQGPDAQDVWSDNNVGFGHALLKTTWDAKNEKQPLTFDNQVWITGDIRLDRRDELIAQLQSAGQSATSTDPDVNLLLLAYLAWGDACLQKITGDFAFAIWDKTLQRLFCARDQFGVVPFYYAIIDNQLIASNHLHCIRKHPNVTQRFNDRAVGDFLLFGMNYDLTATTFKDIQKLPPAHQLVWSKGKLQLKHYWQLPNDGDSIVYNRSQDYIEHFNELFKQSIADRLRTHQAASHLSGGMDSTSIAATAYDLMQASGKNINFRSYAIVYKDLLQEQEGKFAEQVAHKSGFPLQQLIADDYLQQPPLAKPDYLTPEPLMFSNQVVENDITLRVSGFSRTLFAGFGGDPALYPAPSFWYQLLRKGKLLRLSQQLFAYLYAAHRLPPFDLRTQLSRRLGQKKSKLMIPAWLNPDFANQQALHERFDEILTTPPRQARNGMSIAPLWSNIFAWSSPGFHGMPVKVRFPFFDVRLITFLQCVPPAPWFIEKRLLRKAMLGTLPNAILERPKTPLPSNPQYNMMQQRGVQPWMHELAKTRGLEPYVSQDSLLQTFNQADKLTPSSFSQSMLTLTLAYWINHQ